MVKEKMPKKVDGKSTRLGGGGRFADFTNKLEAKGYSADSAKAIAAAAGRKRYGASKMASMSAAGRKRAGKK